MAIHELKSWPRFFAAIKAGRRKHELRRNDRDFKEGDILLLREWNNELQEFTGDVCNVRVTAITSRENPCAVSDQGLNPEFCILSVELVEA